MKVMLLDDHQMMVEGLAKLFNEQTFIEVVGAYQSEQEFLEAYEKTSVDLLVLDFCLGSGTAFDLIEQLKISEKTLPKIVIISGMNHQAIQKRAIELGVAAFLPKESGIQETIACLQSVLAGYTLVPKEWITEKDELGLTKREREIIQMVAEEYTNEQIAQALFLSRRTIESQLAVVFQKLGVQTRVGVVKKAIQLHLVK